MPRRCASARNRLKSSQRAVLRVDAVVVGDVVAVVARRRADGHQPDAGDAEVGGRGGVAVVQVVEPLDQALQVADAVVGERTGGRVGEGAHEDLVEDAVGPPRRRRRCGRGRNRRRGAADAAGAAAAGAGSGRSAGARQPAAASATIRIQSTRSSLIIGRGLPVGQRITWPSASSTCTSPSPSSRIGCSMVLRSPITTQVMRPGSSDSRAAARTASSVCASRRDLSVRT